MPQTILLEAAVELAKRTLAQRTLPVVNVSGWAAGARAVISLVRKKTRQKRGVIIRRRADH
ncbi:hypothetical protein KCP69_10895 [Salmonella enterica subsp. enterica]|nr:hypothetical protein KCP69_10895 [Salmonella enterica subsp. enterica]